MGWGNSGIVAVRASFGDTGEDLAVGPITCRTQHADSSLPQSVVQWPLGGGPGTRSSVPSLTKDAGEAQRALDDPPFRTVANRRIGNSCPWSEAT
jgi:hypothetical protein